MNSLMDQELLLSPLQHPNEDSTCPPLTPDQSPPEPRPASIDYFSKARDSASSAVSGAISSDYETISDFMYTTDDDDDLDFNESGTDREDKDKRDSDSTASGRNTDAFPAMNRACTISQPTARIGGHAVVVLSSSTLIHRQRTPDTFDATAATTRHDMDSSMDTVIKPRSPSPLTRRYLEKKGRLPIVIESPATSTPVLDDCPSVVHKDEEVGPKKEHGKDDDWISWLKGMAIDRAPWIGGMFVGAFALGFLIGVLAPQHPEPSKLSSTSSNEG